MCLTLLLACSSAPVRADDWSYTLRPGDDLWRIAQRYCGEIGSAAKIAQHNGIADPAMVRAGQRINIPTAWLVFEPSTAKIIATSGDVRISRGTSRSVQQVPARTGDIVRMGQLLTTGEGSAVIEFADGSTLALKPNSEVLFNKLTAFGPAGMVDTHLRFAYGRGTATVKPQNRGDRFRVATPEGVAAVRGTEFRIGHQGDAETAVSNTETLEGRVEFDASGQLTDLPAGYGVAVSGTSVVREALLAAPTFIDSTATETTPGAMLSWAPLAGASAYIATWLDANALGNAVAQRRTATPQILVDVATGSYELAVRGVSASGVEGFDARRAVSVRDPGPLNLSVDGEIAGDVTLTWTYPEPRDATATQTEVRTSVTLDAAHWDETRTHSTSATSLTLNLGPGRYTWQAQGASSAPSSHAQFALRPRQPENVVVDSKRRLLSVTWGAVPDAHAYVVRVAARGGDGTTVARELSAETQAVDIEVAAFGDYRVSVVAVANDLHSDAAERVVHVHRRPWWLLAIGAVILAL